MLTNRAMELFRSFKDKTYRQAFAAEVGTSLATQIRLLREARSWRQQDLADHLGVKQAQISQLENPDYGKFSLSTLLKLAATFDVPLIVRFGTYSELAEWHASLTSTSLAPSEYRQEAALLDAPLTNSRKVVTDGGLMEGEAGGDEVPPGHVETQLLPEVGMSLTQARVLHAWLGRHVAMLEASTALGMSDDPVTEPQQFA